MKEKGYRPAGKKMKEKKRGDSQDHGGGRTLSAKSFEDFHWEKRKSLELLTEGEMVEDCSTEEFEPSQKPLAAEVPSREGGGGDSLSPGEGREDR